MSKLSSASTTLAVLTLAASCISLGYDYWRNQSNHSLIRSSNHSSNHSSTDSQTHSLSRSSIDSWSNPSAPGITSQNDPFLTAIDRATAAYAMSQAAQSGEDWRLAATSWQQAIDVMAIVPVSSPHRLQAQQRLAEYQQNLANAQQNAKLSAAKRSELQSSVPKTAPTGIIAVSAPQNLNKTGALPINQPPPRFSPSSQSFVVPIVRREGSTPVIHVTFNSLQNYEMIVDTGASGTLITPSMASTLGIVPISETRVDTASQRGVAFPMGYVQSMSAGGVEVKNVLVAVASTELRLGLLGHDFFGNYDVTIREHEVEFQER